MLTMKQSKQLADAFLSAKNIKVNHFSVIVSEFNINLKMNNYTVVAHNFKRNITLFSLNQRTEEERNTAIKILKNIIEIKKENGKLFYKNSNNENIEIENLQRCYKI